MKPLLKKEWPIQPYIPIHFINSVYIDRKNGDAKSWYLKGSVLDYEIFTIPEYGSDWGLGPVFKLITQSTVLFTSPATHFTNIR